MARQPNGESPPKNLIESVVSQRLWGSSDLCLIDVGASGGIDRRWSVFGDRLTAVGFDPLVAEIDRLNSIETRAKVRYEAASVTWRDYDRLFPPDIRNDRVASRYNQPYERCTAMTANQVLQRNYVREIFNSGAPLEYSSRTITLDEFLASSPDLRPDFLKIDTDGSDYQVLLGAGHLLESDTLLGVSIECQFHGAVHEFANSFSNIDRFLRQRGFSLFDLSTNRYSRDSLPAPFATGIAAQTASGQVIWGDALYFRDLGHSLYEAQFGVAPTRERLLKLCCLFAFHELHDCAAELLATSESLRSLPERAALLDALTPNLFGEMRHEDYVARFRADPLGWLPQNIRRDPNARQMGASPVPPATSRSSAELREKNARLRERILFLKERVHALKEERSELRQRLRSEEEARQELVKSGEGPS